MITGTCLYAWRARDVYDIIDRSGLFPETPPGVNASVDRGFPDEVYPATMESRLPEVIKKARAGLPKAVKSRLLSQAGCEIIPVLNPSASRTLPIMAAPKDGWST